MNDTKDIEFTSLQELYNRLLPALKSKKSELDHLGYNYIKEDDIWNYLKEEKWSKAFNLLLYQMVDDVINANPIDIDIYFKNTLVNK